jgi:succinylglutamic semialdehyde dehydrogenase
MSRGLFIDGKWVPGGGPPFDDHDPGSGEVIWRGAAASRSQVHEAVVAADRAFADWSTRSLEARIEVVRAFGSALELGKAALAETIARDSGKPRWEALTEVQSMIGKIDVSIRAQAERAGTHREPQGDGQLVIRHRPHGVLAVLGPYNFPGHLPNGHIVPALLAGNTVVFKPSELTPMVAERTVALWEAAGLPAGVLNLVQGGRDTGETLASHDDLDGILFTGSAQVGHALHQLWGGRPDKILALEMGGSNPLVAWSWPALDAAAVAVIQSAFVTAGQRCTCARRLIVPAGEAGEQLVARVIELARALRVDRWDAEPAPFCGPVISGAAAERLLAAQTQLVGRGARMLLPMARLPLGPAFLSPGVLDVSEVRDLPDEEHFGPLLLVQRAASVDEAIGLARRTRFGLAAGLLSTDRALWERFIVEVRAGVMNWNRPLPGASSAAPFGGVGASGNHRPSAAYAADYCAYPVASLKSDTLTLPASLPPGLVLSLR